MGDMTAQLLVYGLVMLVLGVIGGAVYIGRTRGKAVIESAVATVTAKYDALPQDYKDEINQAVKLGADFAEAIDLNGKIADFMKDFQTKGEAKLNAAVDTAAQMIELYAKERGYTIDVPEELIKRLIEAYVFNNKDQYPSKGIKDNG